MAPPTSSKRSLVMCDGDLPSMVALSLTQDAVGGFTDADVLAAPVVPAAGDAVSAHIRQYAEAQAAQCLDFPAVAPGSLTSGARRNRYLGEAAHQATSNGYAVLVCPWLAEAFDPDSGRSCHTPPGVDALARELDRTLLISRLVTLDASEHGASVFEVQAPLMDLTDAQVAEMALDLDVPIWRTWWWEHASAKRAKDSSLSALAGTLRTRWCTALESLGWSPDVEAAAER